MLKKVLKSIFASAGFEIKNKKYKDIFTIRETMFQALEQLKNIGFNPGLIIDVGAADGTPPLQICFPNSNFFWVEPLQEFQSKLEGLKKKLKGDYLIAALGKTPGTMKINVSSDKVGSSILDSEQPNDIDNAREIKIDTLENVAGENNFGHYEKILLKIDVQGFELEVLEGTGNFLNNIDVVILEVSFFNFLKDCPDIYDVIAYMKKKGFAVYDIVGGINRPKDMALGQKDVIFVKEDGHLRKSHSWN